MTFYNIVYIVLHIIPGTEAGSAASDVVMVVVVSS